MKQIQQPRKKQPKQSSGFVFSVFFMLVIVLFIMYLGSRNKPELITETTTIEARQPLEKPPTKEKVTKEISRNKVNSNSRIKKILKSKGLLSGKESIIIEVCNNNNIDPLLLIAISFHETDYGTSTVIRNQNNPGGLSYKGNFISYKSLNSGITAMAKLLGRYKKQGKDTLEKIKPSYCPNDDTKDKTGINKCWLSRTKEIYNEIVKIQ